MKTRLVEVLGTAVILTSTLAGELRELPVPPALPVSPAQTVALFVLAFPVEVVQHPPALVPGRPLPVPPRPRTMLAGTK
jgi:hypothetical protein